MNHSLALVAYIDPVSGVILLQLMIGGCIGLFAGFHRRIWRFCTGIFGRRAVRDDASEATSPVPATISFPPHLEAAQPTASAVQEPMPLPVEARRAA
jgi:hypothetical protein